jgi:hypothetical protein
MKFDWIWVNKFFTQINWFEFKFNSKLTYFNPIKPEFYQIKKSIKFEKANGFSWWKKKTISTTFL